MTTITLPPLPTHPTNGIRQWWTADQLRARDLEVARMVLEGAANRANVMARTQEHKAMRIADAIRALEVKCSN